MKIRITRPADQGIFSAQYVQLITAPHNIQFDHVKKNLLYFRVNQFPRKEIMQRIREIENQEFSISSGQLRAAFKKQGVNLCFVVRYNVKTPAKVKRSGNVLNSYTVIEKEQVFTMYGDTDESEKQEIVKIVDPYAWRLRTDNSAHDAETILSWFDEWAHPATLESVTASLTNDQKAIAAKLLKAYFNY